ncbi:hypothetical protein ACIBKY_24265 [Nonomuraea sp. NPDC050394]|uniref:imine reductase family protein n=1 Tax=Nonomuraea sp. NPDC050394 TaxID=3364363 RepID=UPI003791A6EA
MDEAVAAADVTIVCLNDYASTTRILGPVGDGLRGRTVVNLTSGTPSEARELAAWAGERGSVFLYSGPREVFDEHRATPARVGDPRYLGELEMNLNALEHITRTSVEQGVPAERPRLMLEIAERAVARGRGSQNYLAVYEVFRKCAADAGFPASSMSG